MEGKGERTFRWIAILRHAREHWTTMGALAVVMLLVGTLDALFPMMNGIAVDRFIIAGSTQGLGLFIALYALAAVVIAFLIWYLIVLAGRIEMGLMHTFRRITFEHLQVLSLSYFDRTPAGWIMARLTSDVQRLGETIAWGLVDIVWGTTMMVAVATAMILINARLALLVLLVVPPLALASFWFQRTILGAHRKVRQLNSRISAAFNEGILGTATSKVLVRETDNLREFSHLTGRMRTVAIRAALLSSLYMPVVLLLGSAGTAIALVAGGIQVDRGEATLGTVVAFISYTILFFEPVREVARVLTELQSARSAAERILGLLAVEPEITDTPEVEAQFGTVLAPRRENWPTCRGEVRFEHVTFAYPGGEPVLRDFNLHVRAGEIIALVGETGSGKTTIVNLINRFYEPQAGRILVDGEDLRRRSSSWIHARTGYVLQTPQLFRGTVRDNIRLGKPGASEEEIHRASEAVAARDVIEALPGGYDYEIGEDGAGLSTGQKQLVAFARTFLSDPRIFILDEATSSIDTETEIRIQRATGTLLRGRTSFVVAHRFSTIRDADRIVVLENGTIREAGTHEELLDRKGAYAALYREQFHQT
ncbi:MAG: ABC transporter ATP-binding protein [Spirochaetaceae bacterium]|nr:MAG: ABC transporter ATP-binding protein [Spirochaetaceae bacterium]